MAPPTDDPDDLDGLLATAMERAAMAGLCRDGQLEIAVQEGRAARPDLADDALWRRARAVYAANRDPA
ncbi:MAG: hypothetical protein H6907_01610 [Hyphomicrobiales bacterium]|nr:hypothetical protein [Hyphomicrobiales bacterium]MCP5370402.1 hypothetical protein [Hyphomicrobiales bacterium]